MMKTTKLATSSDAPALAAVWNGAFPERPTAAEAFTKQLATSALTSGYLLAEGRGYAQFDLSQREGDPEGKYWVYSVLTRAAQEDGAVVEALFEGLLDHLRSLGGRFMFTMAQPGQGTLLQALEGLGFREWMRSFGANLELSSVDLTAYGDPEAALAARGITIRTLSELRADSEHAPELIDKLHALYLGAERDMPEVGHNDTKDASAFGAHLTREDALPDAFFIAVHGGDLVGYSELARGNGNALRQETTAVLRPYRRRGVALALKLRGLAYAKGVGAARINTGMASHNRPMIALNTRLGFVPEPPYITLVKDVSETTRSP